MELNFLDVEMKRLLLMATLMATIVTACTTREGVSTRISGRFVGNEVDTVYLERVNDMFAAPERLEGVALADNGAFSFEFQAAEGSPRLYKLTFSDDTRPVTLAVTAGEEIYLESAGDIFLNYTVEGSEESALICEFNRTYFAACDQLARIAENINRTPESFGELKRQAFLLAQNAIQTQVRFVGSHQSTVAAIYALRYRVAEQYIPQLDGYGIGLAHYRSVYDAILERYPDSPYLALLEHDIAELSALRELGEQVEVINYPDLELEDIYKNSHRLSSLDGQVILLNFWSATSAQCNTLNAELKELYARYHDRGFEIYQVSADGDTSLWIEAVRQQRHPWISVHGGNNPEIFSLYNIATLPASYLIDREGNIEPCNYGLKELESELKRLL